LLMTLFDIRAHAKILLILFALQFLAGMLLNLFVTLPKVHPGTTGDNYFTQSWESFLWTLSGRGGWTLAVHASIAVALLIGTAALLVRTLSRPGQGWRWGSGIAALFTLGALFNGLSFADYNQDFSSMIMATCWLIAVTAVVIPLTRGRKILTTHGIFATQ
jgi:hypothetical protein